MLQFDLTAQVRNKFGKGGSRSLRREGMTPAILYGAKKTDPVALQLNTKIFTHALLKLQRQNAVFSLDVEGDGSKAKHHVMVKELQTNPINDTLVHADLLEILLDEPMSLQVPVHYTGKAKGVEMGGELHVNMQTVTLSGLVMDIPDFIEIDVTELDINDRLNCGDLNIPAGIEILEDADLTCVAVGHPAKVVEEEVEEEEGEEGAEAASEEGAAAEEAPAAE